MNELFLKKQILKVIKSYTNDANPVLSLDDFAFLISKIEEQRKSCPGDEVNDIIHDVVYEYVTTYFW